MSIIDLVAEKLRTDIANFADPHSVTNVKRVEGATLMLEWTRSGTQHDALFVVKGDGTLAWEEHGQPSRSYDDFLRSPRVANFEGLATAIESQIEPQFNYIACDGEIAEPSGGRAEEELSPEYLSDLLDSVKNDGNGQTELLFVKGDAGTGKTTLLRELVRHQATEFLAGNADSLAFYVPAKGRELSNLEDAFASEIDDLGGFFSKRAIYTLCQRGLIVPIIDGFDELLGSAGYKGSFAALQEVFERLDGLGSVVVSARSMFYEHEFAAGMGSESAYLSRWTFDLKPWSDSKLRTFLDGNAGGVPSQQIEAALDALSDSERELLHRPFFAQGFPSYLQLEPGERETTALSSFLIDQYVSREQTKIVDENGNPVMELDDHYLLLELASYFMWTAETSALPVTSLESIAEMVGDERDLGAEGTELLKRKLTSYAGFELSRNREFRFEHELYFDYFLGNTVGRLLASDDLHEVDDLMAVGEMSIDALQRAVDSARLTADTLPDLLFTAEEATPSNVKRNKATLAVAYASRQEGATVKKTTFTHLEFFGQALGKTEFYWCDFDDCIFSLCDFSGTVFEDCHNARSQFTNLKVDGNTVLGISGLVGGESVNHLTTAAGDIYDPARIQELVERLGADGSSSSKRRQSAEAKSLLAVVERIARAFSRATVLFDDVERVRPEQKQLLRDPMWEPIRDLLIDSGCIVVDHNYKGGANAVVLRLKVAPAALASGSGETSEDPRISRFWKAASRLYP